MTRNKDRIFLGAFLVIISVFLIASMATIAKFLSKDFHPIELSFYRNLLVFTFMSLFLIQPDMQNKLKTKRQKDIKHIYFVVLLELSV